MTPSKAQKIFSEIIWNANLSGLHLTEYLNTYPDENQLWVETEIACKKAGICLWSVQTK